MRQPATARHGEWDSPFPVSLLTAGVVALIEVRANDGVRWWLEGRPDEKGRQVLIRRATDGNETRLTPEGFNVRTRVHEYGGAAYVAAKHGVVGLTRQMAVTYSSRGITINAVCPGPILTGLRAHSQQILGPGVPDMSGRGIAVDDAAVCAIAPAGRRGTVEEIASAVCYLASDEAGYITGHSMVVDGGWRAK